MRRILSVLALAAMLAGCGVTVREPFDPAAASIINQTGSGSVSGQAFMRRRDGIVVYGAGSDVYLVPVTAYSEARVKAIFGDAETIYLELPVKNEDPRYLAARRHEVADGEGRFTFENVAPGDYFVFTWVGWFAGNAPQGGSMVKRVHVGPGPVKIVMTG